MSEQLTLTVELTESESEALESYSDERLAEAMREGLEELASAQEKRDELRDRRPESSDSNTEELSGEALEQAMREWLRGKRESDPRLQ
jgi:hypothetical protein